ncbi:MAG: lysylphosphatidylglycerol synthase transmembrane domain-containing protein [Solirubrobacteraceae bacterium]
MSAPLSEPRPAPSGTPPGGHHVRHALGTARGDLRQRTLKLAGYLVAAYLVIKVLPGLERAVGTLERVHWQWVLGAVAVEVLSEMGFVVSWRAIVDPEDVLSREGRGERMGTRVAWAQLGGGMLVPGGSLSSPGVGTWLLHRFGMPTKLVAERQFNLSFLNTGIDAIALIVFGLGLWLGIFPGKQNPALTLAPALVAAVGIAAGLLIAQHAENYAARVKPRHPKLAVSIATVADAVEDTKRLFVHRSGVKALLGAVAYLGFDVLVLWGAFIAIGVDPPPSFAVVLMAYIIGALGGSIPLPAGLGAVGGMVGMLILFGVGHTVAVAVVLIYQAIGQLVPLIGGGIAYLFLRSKFGVIGASDAVDPAA